MAKSVHSTEQLTGKNVGVCLEFRSPAETCGLSFARGRLLNGEKVSFGRGRPLQGCDRPRSIRCVWDGGNVAAAPAIGSLGPVKREMERF